MVQGNRNPNCTAGTAENLNQALGGHEPTAPPSWAANATSDPQVKASASAEASKDVASILPTPSGSDVSGSDGSTQAASQGSGSTSVPNILPIALALLGGTAIGIAGFAWFAARRNS